MVHTDTAIEKIIEYVVTEHLSTSSSGQLLGAVGPIAEFMDDKDEALLVDLPFSCAISRVAIRVVLRQLTPFEGETARVLRRREVHDSARYETDDHRLDH